MTRIEKLVREKQVIICCGAGGVGKTTTAASIALLGARLGKRVLVLTIDPSLRLAQALGVERNPRHPVAVSAELQAAAGVAGTGSLHAWMLDPKAVADDAIHAIVKDRELASKYLENRIYRQFTRMVTGMHEYTAMKAVHGFVRDNRYDLVVLDTPPSRHALDFLEAPGRVAQFLDGRILKLFMPVEQGFIFKTGRKAASKLVSKAISTAFGNDLAGEMTTFVSAFSGIFGSLNQDLAEIRKFLAQKSCAFLLVTSPSRAALTEAFFFHDKTVEMGLPFEGFVLNRSHAQGGEKLYPSPDALGLGAENQLATSALAKLHDLARQEQVKIERDRQLLAELGQRAGASAFAVALPGVIAGDQETSILLTLVEGMLRP
jgi:anion-transporting  ArsA/GET3 family ATPase